jgi:predicted metal-dependent enzyme (double-stranded beta helix superfamily)
MRYTIDELAAGIRDILTSNPGRSGKEAICRLVSEAVGDAEFVARYLQSREAGGDPREVLYEDPELGFCICGHVYSGEAIGKPHDHGPSWAIYGQAEGETEMTDWKIVKPGSGDEPTLVEPERTYRMKPGDVRYYDVGDIHSPHREKPVKLLRIEGENLDHIQRSSIRANTGTA